MKKTLILSVVFALAIIAAFFAYNRASAQDYYDSYGTGGYGGFDSGSYGSYGSYGGSSYDSYGTGGYGGFDNYGSSYSGYDQYGCGSNCYGGSANYSSYDSYGGCGSSCYGGYSGGYSSGCGSLCGGFGGYYGGYGYNTAFLPPVYVSPRYNPPVTLPPIYIPPVYNPPTYLPPVYVPPAYNPPSYLPPIYTPPTYNPPIYYPPPVIIQPPLVCSIAFSNFNPPLVAAEGRLYSYNLQSYSTGSASNQISYRLVTGPDGLLVMPNGQIVWTPAFNQGRATSYMVTVAAYNGNCENSQTFYITVQDMNPVPPPQPIVYYPKPKPACTIVTTTVTTTCLPKPLTPQYGICPPDGAAAAVASATVIPTDNSIGGSDSGFGIGSAISAALAGLFGALLALLYSPWLLLAVIIILVIMLVRAYQRTRGMLIAI